MNVEMIAMLVDYVLMANWENNHIFPSLHFNGEDTVS